jgi:hypothetical protein
MSSSTRDLRAAMAVVPVAVRPMGFRLITPVRDARMVRCHSLRTTRAQFWTTRLIIGPTIFESLMMREERNRASYNAIKIECYIVITAIEEKKLPRAALFIVQSFPQIFFRHLPRSFWKEKF